MSGYIEDQATNLGLLSVGSQSAIGFVMGNPEVNCMSSLCRAISRYGFARAQRSLSLTYIVQVRKAYTITKQRERWTDSEHDRFLQALKRYGRAWRKIEGDCKRWPVLQQGSSRISAEVCPKHDGCHEVVRQ